MGYTHEEVLYMTKKLPSFYSMNIDTIKKKKEFYDSIGMKDLFIKNPKYAMQSISLSSARYEFYKERGIDIENNNYIRLFVGQKEFIRKYGFTNVELIGKYRYRRDEDVKTI